MIRTTETGVRAAPLDVFTANVAERFQVTKALTPEQDGDANGGTIDLQTFTAFDEIQRVLRGNFSFGRSHAVDSNIWGSRSPISIRRIMLLPSLPDRPGRRTIASLRSQDLDLTVDGIDELVLAVRSRRQVRIQLGSVIEPPALHLGDQRLMAPEQRRQLSFPATSFRVGSVSSSIQGKDVPEAVKLPVFTEEVGTAQVCGVEVPDPHGSQRKSVTGWEARAPNHNAGVRRLLRQVSPRG